MSESMRQIVVPGEPEEGATLRRTYTGEACLIDELQQLGWSIFTEASPGALGEHWHAEEYEICYVLRGNLTWWAQQTSYDLHPGDLFLTWPREPHGGVNGVMHPCELLWLGLRLPPSGPCLGLTAAEADALREELAALPRRHGRGAGEVRQHFERLFLAHQRGGPLAPGLVRATLVLLCNCVLCDLNREPGRTAASPRVERAIVHLHRHFDQPLRIDDLVAASGLGGSQFRTLFKRQTGHAPAEYLTLLRVRHAQKLLCKAEPTITDIAFRCGFRSSQYFATVFRRHSGMSPRAFRRQVSDGQDAAAAPPRR